MDPQMLSTVIIALILALGTLAGRWTDNNRKVRAEWKRVSAENVELIQHAYACHREIARLGGHIPTRPEALEPPDDE